MNRYFFLIRLFPLTINIVNVITIEDVAELYFKIIKKR